MAEFVLYTDRLLKQYAEISSLCDSVSFSFKTNPLVGELLEEITDCGFSIHSLNLLQRIKDKTRVLFFAQAWDMDRVRALFALGVTRFSVDNHSDLDVLLSALHDEKITLFLRMKLKENTIKTEKHFVYGFRSQDVNKLLVTLSQDPRIAHLGVHVHRKTQNISEWQLREELAACLSTESLQVLTYINIGGGIPISYKNSRIVHLQSIFSEILALRLWLSSQGISLICEPGRFLAGPCIDLHAKILNIYDGTIIVDCSIFNAAMDTFIANVRLNVLEEDATGDAYVIKGISPDSPDIFRYRVFLKNPQIGDILTFLHAGAYNFCTDFCGFTPLLTRIS